MPAALTRRVRRAFLEVSVSAHEQVTRRRALSRPAALAVGVLVAIVARGAPTIAAEVATQEARSPDA
jgi:hypothetical protein